jgi:hypothetical protein
VFRLLAKQVDPAAAQELDKHLATLASTMSTPNPDRATVASEASVAAPIAQRMAERLAAIPYDQELAFRMLRQITSDAENISLADERAAEQATMAIDSLYIAYSKETKPKNAEEVRSAINRLFQQLENPSAYNADQFAAALRRLHGML